MSYNYSKTIDFLLDWYDLNARVLAWRENPKPYYIWISEIMLQQTRVEAVKSYFDRFIKALPDIQALAAVEEETLLKLWEGLGYYNRARNLKKTAELLMLQYDGRLPADYEQLKLLPGIGSYTAGAIASIAFQIPVPAVDGNVLRVMKRIAGSFDDITNNKVKKELESDLLSIMPDKRPGDFNQSIMELGAVICIPNGKPLCKNCPIMHLCEAFYNGTELNIPVKTKKKARKIEDKTILLIECQGKFALEKRPPNGLLAGLWQFPNLPEKQNSFELEKKLLLDYSDVLSITSLEETKHIFSHIEWHMIGYYIRLKNFPASTNKLVWISQQDIDSKYCLPSAFETYKKHAMRSFEG